MARATQLPKDVSFNLRLDPALKAAFTAAAEAEDRPASQVLRAFMRAYVKRRKQRVFTAEARRQSELAAQESLNPASDEYRVMRELEAELDDATLWQD